MEEANQDIERLESTRPRITDPSEMQIIREIYFKDDVARMQMTDNELADRIERSRAKRKYLGKSSR